MRELRIVRFGPWEPPGPVGMYMGGTRMGMTMVITLAHQDSEPGAPGLVPLSAMASNGLPLAVGVEGAPEWCCSAPPSSCGSSIGRADASVALLNPTFLSQQYRDDHYSWIQILLCLRPGLILIHTQTQLHLQCVLPCVHAHNTFNSIVAHFPYLSSHPYPLNRNNSDNKTIISGSVMNTSFMKAVVAVPAEGRLKVFDVWGTTSRRWKDEGGGRSDGDSVGSDNCLCLDPFYASYPLTIVQFSVCTCFLSDREAWNRCPLLRQQMDH
ncbi:hypothetical protein BT96DRAFT_522835 [Gymnopus androsaceus JB14]|uniref:Uncharacterized protein n=1 Tax=Gymnopus androsaceus JB14 TaxID=1447944 RepID=A0A6A4GL81_9AGAR|nr:hypothetical protein BT96DRAFT_522835 [Gymnopus androsaceus JB14]